MQQKIDGLPQVSNLTFQEEAKKIMEENEKLTEQIKMWKVVETLQNNATLAEKAARDMTTIEEEESCSVSKTESFFSSTLSSCINAND